MYSHYCIEGRRRGGVPRVGVRDSDVTVKILPTAAFDTPGAFPFVGDRAGNMNLLVFYHQARPYTNLSRSAPPHQRQLPTRRVSCSVIDSLSFGLSSKTCTPLELSLFEALCIRGRRTAAVTVSIVLSTIRFTPLDGYHVV